MDLNRLLKKQVTIASWQLGLFLGAILGIILLATSWTYETYSDGYYGSYREYSMGGQGYFGIILITVCDIALLVLWIIGIVNAVKINGITGNSAILVVFSVITLLFGHLIVAVSQKNRYGYISSNDTNHEPKHKPEPTYAPKQNSHHNNQSSRSVKEQKLRQAFMDGIISSAEYEKKMKELDNENK